jgi:tRNA 2-thiouridine synthesizing protein A
MTNLSEPEYHVELDATGLQCPMPLIHAKLTLNKMAAREVLKVKATDAGTRNDFRTHCEYAGHQILGQIELAGVLTYWIRKG